MTSVTWEPDAQLGEADELGHDCRRVGAEGVFDDGLRMIGRHEVCHHPRGPRPAGIPFSTLSARWKVEFGPIGQTERSTENIPTVTFGPFRSTCGENL